MELNIPSSECDLIRDLIAQHARFLVIGGYAVKFFGCRTVVHDLDLLIDNSKENAAKVFPALVTALDKLHHSPAFNEQALTKPRNQLKFPNELVDVLTSSNQIDFSAAWERRSESRECGIIIPIISKKDLIKIKKEAAEDSRAPGRREKELTDIECLERSEFV